jgi:surfactin synthase thioesterase subunit
VLAAAVGGIPEAKVGVPYLLPVTPIETYAARLDDRMVPVAEVPAQNIEPWAAALAEVTGDRRRWEDVARASRAAALGYAAGLSVAPFEQLLENVAARPRSPRRDTAPALRGRSSPPVPATALSPEKRALLRLRIRRQTGAAEPPEWFPNMRQAAGARLRLLCFPYAGGGTSVFRNWQESMPAGVVVMPARMPGRESRAGEPPIDRIEVMVEAVAAAVRPHLDAPFALFGHSLGAMICFELARRLRREQLPQPRALLVAGARAPQFRRGHVPAPAPSDEQFLGEIRELDGAPREVLENPELLRFLLPALKADATLGRLYVYQDEPPLAIPIRAYRGLDDQRLPRDVIAAWSGQTTAPFALREFPGGHFFLHSNEEEFLPALAADLSAFC